MGALSVTLKPINLIRHEKCCLFKKEVMLSVRMMVIHYFVEILLLLTFFKMLRLRLILGIESHKLTTKTLPEILSKYDCAFHELFLFFGISFSFLVYVCNYERFFFGKIFAAT